MKNILIVEDNPSHLKLAVTLLEKAGYAVTGAANAEKGLLLAQQRRPELILMDIQLPGMGGIEAVQRLKQMDVTRDIPVIAVTAYLATYSEAEVFAVGCAAIIAKPYHYKDFLDAIAAALGGKP